MAFGSREKGTLATGNRALCHCQRWSVFGVDPTIDQGSMAGLCQYRPRASATRCVSRSLETQSIDAPTRASRNWR